MNGLGASYDGLALSVAGKVKKNVVPCPAADFTHIRPSCDSMIPLTR